MQTLIPIFLLIALGAALHYRSFPTPDFWPAATRITYYLFLPALLVSKVAATQFSGNETLRIALIIIITTLTITLLILGTNRWLGYSGPVVTSILQGGIRVNTYVGLATAAALFGNEGLAMAGLVHGIWVPTVNTICVGALVVYCGAKPEGDEAEGIERGMGLEMGLRMAVGQSIGALAKNPMILACALGLLISFSDLALPQWLADTLDILGRAGLPLGLLLVGAGLRMESIRQLGTPVLVASGAKLIIMPMLVWGLSSLFSIGAVFGAVLVLVASLPSAASSYVLAQEMGGDADLMAGILTVETVIAVITMPLIIGL